MPYGHRLEVSRRVGDDFAIDSLRGDPVAEVADATDGQGADLVIEASGNPEALDQGLQMARDYGTVAMFGLPEGRRIDFDYFTAACKQLTLVGTVSATCEAPARPIQLAVDTLGQSGTDLSWLITHRLDLDEAPKAYDLYANRADGVIKTILEV